MLCDVQFKCKNCHEESKCYNNCERYEYIKNEDCQDNFELDDSE